MARISSKTLQPVRPKAPARPATFGFVAEVLAGDGRPWTARSSEYQWGDFNDRWPLILAGFRKAYQTPSAVWDMPNPDVRGR